MKLFLSILTALVCAALMARATDPSPAAAALEKLPLPTGKLLNRVADFSTWQITYFYAQDKPEKGKAALQEYPAPIDNMYLSAAPRKTTLTRTKPLSGSP